MNTKKNYRKKMSLDDVDAFIFDFDGVLTNNLVFVDEKGKESVVCNRSDGLAFQILNHYKAKIFILSSEYNPVVKSRAKKLKVNFLSGFKEKKIGLNLLVKKYRLNKNKIFYVGNDLNDFSSMIQCGYKACPSDSHPMIKKISNYKLNSRGGDGIVREIVENIFDIDLVKHL